MRRPSGFTGGLLLVAVAACTQATPPRAAVPAADPASAPLVDLSHDYASDAIFWPTAEGFRLEKVADGVTGQGYYYAANNFAGAEHGGTHLDAPVHFAQGRWAVEQIPLDRLVGRAVVVDVSGRAQSLPDYQVSVPDLEAWEAQHGAIEPNSIVLIRTDYARRWPDPVAYLGTAERGEAAVAKLHFPGLHPDGARWLAERRSVKAVGIDTASIDYGQSTGFETHRALYERNIPGFENLTNLHELPARGATVFALPMKIRGGSGAPLRAVAVLPR